MTSRVMTTLFTTVQLTSSVDSTRHFVKENITVCMHWRKAAADTVISLSHIYHAPDEATALAVVLVDKFLETKIHDYSTNVLELTRQLDCLKVPELYASACFLIAMKMKSSAAPCLPDMIRIISLNLIASDLSQCEIEILQKLDWDVNVATGVFFKYKSGFF